MCTVDDHCQSRSSKQLGIDTAQTFALIALTLLVTHEEKMCISDTSLSPHRNSVSRPSLRTVLHQSHLCLVCRQHVPNCQLSTPVRFGCCVGLEVLNCSWAVHLVYALLVAATSSLAQGE
jgi:hypothetical protein